MACKAGTLVGSTHRLERVDRAVLRGWLDTGCDAHGRTVSAETMAAALSQHGHRIGPTTLKDHRGRRCACWRDREVATA